MRFYHEAAIVALAFLLGCGTATLSNANPVLVTLNGTTMGTSYSVKCWQEASSIDEKELLIAIDDLLATINQQMSTYIADSELSKFNASKTEDWFAVSSETAYVVEQSIHFHEITGGASDITIGPLVQLWNFGPEKNVLDKDPKTEKLKKVLAATGCQHVAARQNPPALRKSIANLEIDLSSIAKGYAVDAVAELLIDRGITNAMVEIGGEVRTTGTRPDNNPWRIGIEKPTTINRTLHRAIPLHEMAMATSGDYRNFRESEGRKYSHLIDPKTGRPLPFRGCSVTVLAKTCLEADALATALLVMGDRNGYDWCVEHHVAALFLLHAKQGLEERATPRFQELTANTSSQPSGNVVYWPTILVTFAVFAVALTGMAIGVIVSNRRIKGSCGGLANLRDSQGRTLCEGCTDPSPECSGMSEEAETASLSHGEDTTSA